MTERTAIERSIGRSDYAQLPRHSLLVCGVLVQNPVNLGGLCRTVEAFRLEGLVLADLAIVRSPVFRSVAASSYHWQPLQECSVADLSAWIAEKQQNGYVAIALQADSSAIPLDRFQFPLRSVLVLGQELTGIPTAIAQMCDRAITIPQFGLVESLNVQVAGAIASYEYVRQHALSGE